MFEELNRLTGWSLSCLPAHQSILISGKDVDASFLLHHFISMFLKASQAVLLITAAQVESHYSVVCGKFGVSFEKCKNANKLFIIDLLQERLRDYLQDSCPTVDANNESRSAEAGTELALTLCQRIRAEVHRLSGEGQVLVVLDDITILPNIGIEVGEVANLARSMRLLCQTMPCVFLTQLQLNGFANMDSTLYPICKVNCTSEFSVEGLETGYSKDVHGKVSVVIKEGDCVVDVAKHFTRQYKLSDRNLNLFAAGMSQAVL